MNQIFDMTQWPRSAARTTKHQRGPWYLCKTVRLVGREWKSISHHGFASRVARDNMATRPRTGRISRHRVVLLFDPLHYLAACQGQPWDDTIAPYHHRGHHHGQRTEINRAVLLLNHTISAEARRIGWEHTRICLRSYLDVFRFL